MRGAWKVSALACAALIGLAGCWTSASHGDLIDQRLSALEADSKDQRQALEAQKEALSEQLPKLDAKLKEVSDTLDKVNQATHRTGADVGVRLDELQEQIQQLRGALEETQHRLDQLNSAEQQAQQNSDRKVAAALGPQAVAEQSAKEKAMKLAPADRSALFAAAYTQLNQKEVDVARELFAEYVRRYPKDAVAGEAQYEIGECYYQGGRYKEAAVALGKVTDAYPQSPKVCEARLGLAKSLMGLKLRDDAKAALEETLGKCGGKVAVAKEARALLAELKKKR
jgi:TolA-binding protein